MDDALDVDVMTERREEDSSGTGGWFRRTNEEPVGRDSGEKRL